MYEFVLLTTAICESDGQEANQMKWAEVETDPENTNSFQSDMRKQWTEQIHTELTVNLLLTGKLICWLVVRRETIEVAQR